MHTVWFSHLPTEEQEEFKNLVKNSTRVLNRAKEIIDIEDTAIERFENTVDSYKNPSWAYMQAHINGRKAALQDIKKLFDV